METITINIGEQEFLVDYELGTACDTVGSQSINILNIHSYTKVVGLDNKRFCNVFDMANELGFIDQIEEKVIESIND